MVIGTVGSGKSSIGSAIIGEIEKKQGDIYINGNIAYCPQASMQERKNERDSNPESNVIHKVNLEEKHPFILNLFFIFFFPFICRVKPITNEDIYQIGKKDRCDYTSDKTLEGWG
ncbi:MAG: hypothetical protein EZS28_053686, partial [Streblomastix strix]